MFLFSPYPTVNYRIPNTNTIVPVTNITKRFAVTNFLNNSKATFDEYYIQDGERADIIAYEYYGDQTLDWLIFLVNEIHDPYFQWALSEDRFKSYMIQKYGSLAYAYQTVHHYEKIIQQQSEINDGGVTRIIPEKTLTVDFTTYNSLIASERKVLSIYDHENNMNDNNRHIYLLDLNYTLLIKEQHPYIFDDGAYVR
jgi:hypothetical protein